MKKITYTVNVRPLGEFEGFMIVEDDTTNKEITEKIKDEIEFYIDFDVENNYESRSQIIERKLTEELGRKPTQEELLNRFRLICE